MGFPGPDPGDSIALSIMKALVFRAALAFLTASVYPASAAAPTCATDTHGHPAAVTLCASTRSPLGQSAAAAP